MKRISFLLLSLFVLLLGVQAGNPKKILDGLYFDGNIKSKMPSGYGILACEMYSTEQLTVTGNFEGNTISEAKLEYFQNTNYPEKVNIFKGTASYSIVKDKDYNTLNIKLEDGEFDGVHITGCSLVIKKDKNTNSSDWSSFKQEPQYLTLSGVLPRDFSSFGFKNVDVKEAKFMFLKLPHNEIFSRYTYTPASLALVYNGSVLFKDGSSISTTTSGLNGGPVMSTFNIVHFGSFTYTTEALGAENSPYASARLQCVDITLKDGAQFKWKNGEKATMYYPNNTSFTGGFKYKDTSFSGYDCNVTGIGKFFQELMTATSSDFEITHGNWNN